MLWEEGFITAALDSPVEDTHISADPSVAVSYATDPQRGFWSKTVNLELCDRSSLSSLLSNINFIRKLVSPINVSSNEQSSSEEMQFISLPLSIKLDQCSLTLSYRLSSHGSAFDLLRRCGLSGLPEAAVAVILSRALLGLDRLHSVGVLHRNLCAKHLLLTDFQPNVLLCGLGSICQFPPRGFDVGRNDLPPVFTSWRGWNVQSSADAYSHPLAWYAPEVVVQDFTGYSWPADIYSFGLVMAELYTGQPPYLDLKPTEIMVEKLCGHIPPDLKQTGPTSPPPSEAMLQVYNACTQYNAKNRPTTKSLLQTPWIQWGLGLEPDYDHLENYSEQSPPTV